MHLIDGLRKAGLEIVEAERVADAQPATETSGTIASRVETERRPEKTIAKLKDQEKATIGSCRG